MKLVDIIQGILNEDPNNEIDIKGVNFNFNDESIRGDKLRGYTDKLLEADEFAGVTDIHIVDTPLLEDGEKAIQIPTRLLTDDVKVSGKVILKHVQLTPSIYKPEEFNTPIKDGAILGPVMYDSETFSPYRELKMRLGVEGGQDELRNARERLHKQLDDILDNPSEYMPKPIKKVMVSGIFERVEYDGKVETVDNIDKILLHSNGEPRFGLAYYCILDKVSETGEKLMQVESVMLPMELADEWKEEFGDSLPTLTQEEVDEFKKKYDLD